MKKFIPIFVIAFFILMNVDFTKDKEAIARSIDLKEADGLVAFIVNDSHDEPEKPSVKCECGGTGFITHGDGHKTKCPSENCTAKKEEPKAETCQCGCGKEGCACSDSKKKAQETPLKEDVYTIDKWTASWCGPCKQWQREQAPQLIAAGYKVFELDFDLNNQAAIELQITKVPTAIIRKNGVEISRAPYYLAKDILNFIEKDKSK